MQPTLTSLMLAVEAAAGNSAAQRFGLAPLALLGETAPHDLPVSWEDAGTYLAAALAPAFDYTTSRDEAPALVRAISALPIYQLLLYSPTRPEPIPVPPEEVGRHALVRGWVEPTFGGMLASGLRSIATLSCAAAGAPKAYTVRAVENGRGRTNAEVHMTLEEGVQAIAFYGAPPEPGEFSFEASRIMRPTAFAHVAEHAMALGLPATQGSQVEADQVRVATVEAAALGPVLH